MEISKIFKILDFSIVILIVMIQVYSIFFIYPNYKKNLDYCQKKILCEYGTLNANQCGDFEYGKYYNRNPEFNFPNFTGVE